MRNLEQDVLFQNSGFFNILLEEPFSILANLMIEEQRIKATETTDYDRQRTMYDGDILQ